MARLPAVTLLLGLLLSGSASAAPAPAPGPTRTLVLPQTTTVVAPVPSANGGTAPAPVQQITPTVVTVPAPSQSRQPPANSPTLPVSTSSSPSVAPSTAPTQGTPGTPGAAGTTSTPSGPASAPGSSSPAQAPLSQGATSTTGGASGSTPGTGTSLAPAPAVSPSSSGFYNVTLQANNATGALSQAQSSALSSQIQQYLSQRGGITTQVRIANQSLSSPTSSAGRRLHQQTFTLSLAIVLGPISAPEAALAQQLLNGLQINLGTTVIVIVVVVFVPVQVFVPVPTVINQPPNVPTLPPSTNITIPSGPSPPGTGSNIGSQNVAGGGSITSQGITNNNVVNNVVNNNSTTINNNNSINNINSGNTINSGNSNNGNVNNVNSGNTIITQVQNPTTPGAQAPSTPASPGSTTPGTPATPTPATPATPGGASSGTADTTPTPPTYITQAAPANSQPPPVPSPPPSPPPSCGSQPQCRIFSRDMLCCQNEGILTPYQGAQVEILCTHQVRFAITCLATSGPTNISAASVYNNDYGYNYNFRTNINWLGQTNGYLGKVNVDVQPARFAADRPECSLNLQTPCMQDGTLVSTMPAVQPLSFNVIDFSSFYQNYVGYPPTNAIGQFSYSWMNDTYPGGCLEQPTLTVPGSFFVGAWPSQPGFAYPCNASATYGALKQQCPSVTTQQGSGVTGIAP